MTTSISVVPTGGTVPISLEDLAAATIIQAGSGINSEGHLILGTLAGPIDLGVLPGWPGTPTSPTPTSPTTPTPPMPTVPTPTMFLTLNSVSRNNFNIIEVLGNKFTGDTSEHIDITMTGNLGATTSFATGAVPDETFSFEVPLLYNGAEMYQVAATTQVTLQTATITYTDPANGVFLQSISRTDPATLLVTGLKATGLPETLDFSVAGEGIIFSTAGMIADGDFSLSVPFNQQSGGYAVFVTGHDTSDTSEMDYIDS